MARPFHGEVSGITMQLPTYMSCITYIPNRDKVNILSYCISTDIQIDMLRGFYFYRIGL